jgi:hypothetical protein
MLTALSDGAVLSVTPLSASANNMFTLRRAYFADDCKLVFRTKHCVLCVYSCALLHHFRVNIIKMAEAHYPGAVLMGSYHVVGRQTKHAEARNLLKR